MDARTQTTGKRQGNFQNELFLGLMDGWMASNAAAPLTGAVTMNNKRRWMYISVRLNMNRFVSNCIECISNIMRT